jgi:hypothetical protein
MQNIWISPDIFEWNTVVETTTYFEDGAWRRPYAIWQHAEKLLNNPDTQFNRVDIVTSLKRSIDSRIRLLDHIYEFRKIPIKGKPQGYIELLHLLGIIRYRMVQKLVDIRNAVEHSDSEPPNIEDCAEFIEFTWYFLRSTDVLARRKINQFLFESPDSDRTDLLAANYSVEVEFNHNNNWVPQIHAWLLPYLVSNSPKEEWCLIKAEKVTVLKDARAVGEGIFWQSADPETMYIKGEVRGKAEHLLKIARAYFETV